MSPLVSVIISTYKRPLSLEKALKSVARQTYRPIELIVVDDNPPESLERRDTENVVNSFKDIPLKYVQHPYNQGGATTRNTGIQNAKGELIAFLDDDDIWFEDKLTKQVEHIKGYDILGTAAIFVGRGGFSGRRSVFKKKDVVIDDLIRLNLISYTSSLMCRAHVFKKVLFDKTIYLYDDLDLCINLLKCGFKMGMLNEPLVYIFQDSDRERLTTSSQKISFQEMERRIKFFEKNKDVYGPWLFHCQEARWYLSSIKHRNNKLAQFMFSARKVGFVPSCYVLFEKIFVGLGWIGCMKTMKGSQYEI